MDEAFAFYLVQSLDDGAQVTNLYSKHHLMAPLNDQNVFMFHAFTSFGKSHSQHCCIPIGLVLKLTSSMSARFRPQLKGTRRRSRW